jgi:GTP cyclohydrolase IB
MDILERAHTIETTLPDTQSARDCRGLSVTRAGVRGLRLPCTITDVDEVSNNSVCAFDLGVRIPAAQRGTHMSRLVQCAHELAPRIRTADLESSLRAILKRLDARGGALALRFPWFVEKKAPVSGHSSLLDIEVSYNIQLDPWERRPSLQMSVHIPVTTLCPCSKAISRYGAHNQRSTVSVALQSRRPIGIGELVALVERAASCPVYAVLKREDERYVTETAYENPKFAEDLVRDLHAAISTELQPTMLRVETENHESIHNHAAYALITGST